MRSLHPGFSLLLAAALLAPAVPTVAQSGSEYRSGIPEWVEVDYSGLVDLRQLSHSGESVGMLLSRLEGRSLPPSPERPADRVAHSLLDPLLEPYGFVMADALDSLSPVADPAPAEVGSLWSPGELQPAWAELLRARRYVVESDGSGAFRLILPLEGNVESDPARGTPALSAGNAAERAWRAARPVLRHVFEAERRRLAAGGEKEVTLRAKVHAYRHVRERLVFQLGTRPHEVEIAQTGDDRGRPPLDVAALRGLLDRGLLLEGGRLDPDGSIRLLVSETAEPPTLLGSPLTIEDFAVAYRAVFHGGLAEPYMSLDRGYSPQRSIVNYGGRLRDTRLGWVSLLCDIRFKTFSLGLGILENRDLRPEIRERLRNFKTHLERFASDAASRGVSSQQTRLWFYPDDVDLTLSPQGDVLVMRKVRMTAASERVEETTLAADRGGDPPWTIRTIEAINRDYEGLAGVFPELADLDVVVRLLSFFTWLRVAEAEGQPVPDLDVLLALDLPAAPTPRTYPQLLAFNALPPVGEPGAVDTFDRVPVAEALERLKPASGRPLPAEERFERALDALDPGDPRNDELIRELESYDPAGLDDSALDILAYRAERVRMHQTVLATLPMARREALVERQRAGERLRVFSVGIGGIDLGMGRVLERARGRSRGLSETGSASGRAAARPAPGSMGRPAVTKVSRATGSAAEIRTVLPPHGTGNDRGGYRLRRIPSAGDGEPTVVEAIYDGDGPETRARRMLLHDDGRAASIERFESGRFLRYKLGRTGFRMRVEPTEPAGAAGETPAAGTGESGSTERPEGLAYLRLADAPRRPDRSKVPVELASSERSLVADFPRQILQQLVLGREAVAGSTGGLPGLDPLPPELGGVRGVMVWMEPGRTVPPWTGTVPVLPGEQDPARVARALNRWWGSTPDSPPVHRAVVGTARGRSPGRWQAAPAPGKRTMLILPEGGFPGASSGLRSELESAWRAGDVVSALPARMTKKSGDLVLLVSAEAPGLFAGRLRRLARDTRMRGRLLAGWSLAGPVRGDLPASLLAEGNLAGLGLAEHSLVGTREAARAITAYSDAVSGAAAAGTRADRIDGPFVWFY